MQYYIGMSQYDIGEWLLAHKETLKEIVEKSDNHSKSIFPMDIFLDTYEVGVLDIVRREVAKHFNLSPEDLLLLITLDFAIMILGKDFFKPGE